MDVSLWAKFSALIKLVAANLWVGSSTESREETMVPQESLLAIEGVQPQVH